ncbi:uncharacterized protein LOC119096569 [Pollicipes pollicipes]|uniref:uncharacterized protein LOC119096569 n=1 Tax=Pollicipes pollicipes TaxID=41117 RepID=UPI001884E17E|nr:uncharacterized protein LOC119096569 [Pollicipes pollicipes]
MTRCYHLFNESLTAKEAEDACHTISSDGTLFQPDDSGLLNMTVGLLSSLPAPAPTGLDDYVWVAGDRNAADGTTSECREFVRQTGRITPAHDCGARNWYICQRPPRLCGSPAQQASLIYSKTMVAAEGAVINVTCDDSPRTNGQIRCNAPKWSRPTFCDSKMEAMVEQNELGERGEAMPKMTIRRNELDEREDPMPRMTNYLGAVLGGVIGGTALLVLLGSAMFCTGRRRRGEARRKRRNGAAGVQANNMELVLLNENPTYMPITDSVYSEIDDGEAIYEEPSFSAEHHTTRHSPEPPPLPASPPGCSVSDADGTLAPLIADEPEYEVFPDDDQPIKLPNHATDVNLITDRALSPTELIGAEQTMPGYAIPLVDGCMPAGSERNLSFDSQPTGGGTAAMMGARDDDYAEPFDVEGYQGEGRRSAANTAGAATSKNGQDPDHGHDEP